MGLFDMNTKTPEEMYDTDVDIESEKIGHHRYQSTDVYTAMAGTNNVTDGVEGEITTRPVLGSILSEIQMSKTLVIVRSAFVGDEDMTNGMLNDTKGRRDDTEDDDQYGDEAFENNQCDEDDFYHSDDHYSGKNQLSDYASEGSHNHPLETKEERRYSKRARRLSYKDKEFIVRSSTSNIGATKAHKLQASLQGGYESVGPEAIDYKNFKRKMGNIIGDKDTQLVVDKMNMRKDELHN
ncbi:unnamed protein product [Lactuca saligna]|uniref:Uncharacterized protein n=1 Tax=Lactuca saligna TaxID=75948 RepID=A0AA35ZR25_LACSI|nr:unnamed protein product [Lactuca saligna]